MKSKDIDFVVNFGKYRWYRGFSGIKCGFVGFREKISGIFEEIVIMNYL